MYYEISEETARRSHEMMSMTDYQKDSATAEYRAAVDRAAALVEQQKQQVSPFYHDKLDGLLDRYARRLAEWTNAHNRNGTSCPSVLVCGPANFPTRKKAKQNAREDSLWKEYEEIQGILSKIKSVGTGPIDPTDPHAREMLEDRLRRLQNTLETGKAMNAHYRKHKTMKGFRDYSDEKAAKMDEAISRAPAFAQAPFPDFELASIRGKIKRAQENLAKLDSLEQHKDDAANTLEFDGGKIFLNMEANRLQILFDEIPADDLRAELKSHGFKWSRKNEAGQRQLTRNAIYDAKRILGITDTKPAADEGDAAKQAAPLATPSAEDKTAEIQTAADGQALFPLA
ncbi:MAG: hypothetical protein K2L38_09330 [Dysosmobacter sp.]|nr:hypothetical protein [Dysosmobacter sp.]